MHLVPAPAVIPMKSRVLTRPAIQHLILNAFFLLFLFPSRTISILNAFDRYKRDLSHDPKEEKRETENPLEGRDVTACSQDNHPGT